MAIVLLIMMLTACENEEEPPQTLKDNEEAVETNKLSNIEVIAENLNIPWNITKHKGTFYLSQREGSIQRIDAITGEVTLQPLNVTKEIVHEGEGGLLGFILLPDFDTTNEAFAYHTYQEDGRLRNRVIRLQLQDDAWVEMDVLLDDIPGGSIHNGGRLKIGPDQNLYVTTGDAGNADYAQNLDSLAGKILRMNVDGSIPSDNPFQNSYVYSYGHRNPQGLAWNEDGELFSTEHGQTAHDELNLIEAGNNYGWPVIQGDEEEPSMITPYYQHREHNLGSIWNSHQRG